MKIFTEEYGTIVVIIFAIIIIIGVIMGLYNLGVFGTLFEDLFEIFKQNLTEELNKI